VRSRSLIRQKFDNLYKRPIVMLERNFLFNPFELTSSRMSHNVRAWQVTTGDRLVEIKTTRLDFEERLENWIADDIDILDEKLLVIGRQVPTDFGGYIDLLCIDPEGDLVVVELKRDKTPRDIVAQALDYASWVVGLSHDRISEAATQYLNQSFEGIFQNRFHIDLPETINSNHKIIVVASKIDSSSERIISYLSNRHGVNINAVTFQYFRSSEDVEMLTRVFLLEPEEVLNRARTMGGNKRNPNLTYEQFKDITFENGIGELYQRFIEILKPLFHETRTTRSNINFVGRLGSSRCAIINLSPMESSQLDGLKFYLYAIRARSYFGLNEDELRVALPQGSEIWEYSPNASEDWCGYKGFFTSIDQVENLARILGKIDV